MNVHFNNLGNDQLALINNISNYRKSTPYQIESNEFIL